ncbi:MAG: folylpolyglutamate synthase/dihydrofolate synthase family protein [Nanoarchaeota archaeon]
MKYEEMLDWLYNLRRFGIKPGLEKIAEVMEKLGNPHDKLRIIHVAGTNGKGSVCAMIESILRKNGFKVGMFISPHLVDFREHLQVNRELISKEEVMRLVNKINGTGVELTFFELTTAAAFLYFYEQKVDYAVIEVGMGGRFDATNIVKNPVATVITSLSLDHTQWLGDTLDKITREKAGIIKEKVPLFTCVDSDVIRNVCIEKNSPFILVEDEENTNMNGLFQRSNAGLAAAVARHMKVPENEIKEGLLSVSWPARLEFIEKNILLDCAHNPEGIEKLTEFVNTLNYDKLIVIFGVMKDKNYQEMLSRLPDCKMILTKPKIDRSADSVDLKNFCNNAAVIEDVAVAYEQAKKIAGKNDLIVICGSCYLAGELLAYRNKIPMHPIMWVQ